MFRQFILTLSLVISVISIPLNVYNLEDLDDDNYDIVIDQRQNGTQNFRIRISGLNIALPADEEEPPNSQLSDGDLSSLLFSGLSPASSSQISSSSVTNDKNEFAELASLFDWKKKTSNKKSTDTQSRTKDIPTESQLTSEAKLAIRNYVKGNGRKYKLLVGEKYIIPLIQFLKQQAESGD